jgi:hypothetical protein
MWRSFWGDGFQRLEDRQRSERDRKMEDGGWRMEDGWNKKILYFYPLKPMVLSSITES